MTSVADILPTDYVCGYGAHNRKVGHMLFVVLSAQSDQGRTVYNDTEKSTSLELV